MADHKNIGALQVTRSRCRAGPFLRFLGGVRSMQTYRGAYTRQLVAKGLRQIAVAPSGFFFAHR